MLGSWKPRVSHIIPTPTLFFSLQPMVPHQHVLWPGSLPSYKNLPFNPSAPCSQQPFWGNVHIPKSLSPVTCL